MAASGIQTEVDVSQRKQGRSIGEGRLQMWRNYGRQASSSQIRGTMWGIVIHCHSEAPESFDLTREEGKLIIETLFGQTREGIIALEHGDNDGLPHLQCAVRLNKQGKITNVGYNGENFHVTYQFKNLK